MEFSEVVRRRRMVRNYDGRPVAREKLERILRAARRAPSAGFSQGQSFVAVTEEATRAEIARIVGEASYSAKGYDPWISNAPVHIVCCVNEAAYRYRYSQPDKKGTAGAKDEWPVPWWFIDAGCSMMMLLLAAVAEELAGGFLGFRNETQVAVKGLLSIPDSVQPFGVVTVGYPLPDRPSGSVARGRKPEVETIHWERWSE